MPLSIYNVMPLAPCQSPTLANFFNGAMLQFFLLFLLLERDFHMTVLKGVILYFLCYTLGSTASVTSLQVLKHMTNLSPTVQTQSLMV